MCHVVDHQCDSSGQFRIVCQSTQCMAVDCGVPHDDVGDWRNSGGSLGEPESLGQGEAEDSGELRMAKHFVDCPAGAQGFARDSDSRSASPAGDVATVGVECAEVDDGEWRLEVRRNLSLRSFRAVDECGAHRTGICKHHEVTSVQNLKFA